MELVLPSQVLKAGGVDSLEKYLSDLCVELSSSQVGALGDESSPFMAHLENSLKSETQSSLAVIDDFLLVFNEENNRPAVYSNFLKLFALLIEHLNWPGFRVLGVQFSRTLMKSHARLLYRSLNSSVGHSRDDLISALRILTGIQRVSPSALRDLLQTFDFTLKSLPHLLAITNPKTSKNAAANETEEAQKTAADLMLLDDENVDSRLAKKLMIRRLMVQFVLGFMCPSANFKDLSKATAETLSHMKKEFVPMGQYLIHGIFKGLLSDPLDLIVEIMQRMLTDFIEDDKISKNIKMSVFTSKSMSFIIEAFKKKATAALEQEDSQAEEFIELAKRFFILLCTESTMGRGIAFKDEGKWYCQSETEKLNNRIILEILPHFQISSPNSPNQPVIQAQRDIVLEILKASSDLIHAAWNSLSGLSLDLKASSEHWLSSVNFVTSVLLLPVMSDINMPIVNVKNLLSYVYPLNGSISKGWFARALMSDDFMVKYLSLVLLQAILHRFQSLSNRVKKNIVTMDPDVNEGSSPSLECLFQVSIELKKLLPDFQILITLNGFLQTLLNDQTNSQEENKQMFMTMSSSLFQVMCYMQDLYPEVLNLNRFDSATLFNFISDDLLVSEIMNPLLKLVQSQSNEIAWYSPSININYPSKVAVSPLQRVFLLYFHRQRAEQNKCREILKALLMDLTVGDDNILEYQADIIIQMTGQVAKVCSEGDVLLKFTNWLNNLFQFLPRELSKLQQQKNGMTRITMVLRVLTVQMVKFLGSLKTAVEHSRPVLLFAVATINRISLSMDDEERSEMVNAVFKDLSIGEEQANDEGRFQVLSFVKSMIVEGDKDDLSSKQPKSPFILVSWESLISDSDNINCPELMLYFYLPFLSSQELVLRKQTVPLDISASLSVYQSDKVNFESSSCQPSQILAILSTRHSKHASNPAFLNFCLELGTFLRGRHGASAYHLEWRAFMKMFKTICVDGWNNPVTGTGNNQPLIRATFGFVTLLKKQGSEEEEATSCLTDLRLKLESFPFVRFLCFHYEFTDADWNSFLNSANLSIPKQSVITFLESLIEFKPKDQSIKIPESLMSKLWLDALDSSSSTVCQRKLIALVRRISSCPSSFCTVRDDNTGTFCSSVLLVAQLLKSAYLEGKPLNISPETLADLMKIDSLFVARLLHDEEDAEKQVALQEWIDDLVKLLVESEFVEESLLLVAAVKDSKRRLDLCKSVLANQKCMIECSVKGNESITSLLLDYQKGQSVSLTLEQVVFFHFHDALAMPMKAISVFSPEKFSLSNVSLINGILTIIINEIGKEKESTFASPLIEALLSSPAQIRHFRQLGVQILQNLFPVSASFEQYYEFLRLASELLCKFPKLIDEKTSNPILQDWITLLLESLVNLSFIEEDSKSAVIKEASGSLAESATSRVKLNLLIQVVSKCLKLRQYLVKNEHVKSLITLYGASTCPIDVKIYDLLEELEVSSSAGYGKMLLKWGLKGSTSATGSKEIEPLLLESLDLFDSSTVFNTVCNFPILNGVDKDCYDPRFVLRILELVVLDHFSLGDSGEDEEADNKTKKKQQQKKQKNKKEVEKPSAAPSNWIDLHVLFERNFVALVIVSLSSSDPSIRAIAYRIMEKLEKIIQVCFFPEKNQLMLLFEVLKNSIEDPYSRIPFYHALLFAHCSSIFTRPYHFMYPWLNHYLIESNGRVDLQSGFPLINQLLLSCSETSWRQERLWMLRFIGQSVMAKEDVVQLKAFKKFRVIEALISQLELADFVNMDSTGIKKICLEALLNCVSTAGISDSTSKIALSKLMLKALGLTTFLCNLWSSFYDEIKKNLKSTEDGNEYLLQCLFKIIKELSDLDSEAGNTFQAPLNALIFQMFRDIQKLNDHPVKRLFCQYLVPALRSVQEMHEDHTLIASIFSEAVSSQVLTDDDINRLVQRNEGIYEALKQTPGTLSALDYYLTHITPNAAKRKRDETSNRSSRKKARK